MGTVFTDWRAALDDRLGSDTWRRFLDYSRTQRTSNFGLDGYRPGAVAPDRIAAAKKEARKRSLELLAEANVDRGALQRIHAQAQDTLRESLGPPATGAPPARGGARGGGAHGHSRGEDQPLWYKPAQPGQKQVYHLDWIAPETVLWLPFVANFPLDWVYVAIGADDFRWTQLNDVSTNQAMDSRYVAEQVWIQD